MGHTVPCLPKQHRKGADHNDVRLTLLGNSWGVPVVAWMIGQLFERLGFLPPMSPQLILDTLAAGGAVSVQGRLVRAPLNPSMEPTVDWSGPLANKLSNLISIKGEDMLLTSPTTQLVKYHRLRASVPSKLWRWSIVTVT